MSLRKYMHPRNKYRKVPNFKQLAVLYPEFRKIAITDLSGKVRIDFKREETLRILTKTLLKHDFLLDVDIPPNKLIPTLPLRLNYILWIEDLMKHVGFEEMGLLKGIDIGTGAVCIYPLLLAKIYGCRTIATEVDETSVQSALKNIQQNNLQQFIEVIKVKDETILKNVLQEGNEYHFTMCNPPFFQNDECMVKVKKKVPPRNAPTGNAGELSAPGGERSFVMKMIEESLDTGNKIKIYTTMIGQKATMLYLVEFLQINNIVNFTWTEFCQGHTTRWGLAWTFFLKEEVNLSKAPVIRKGSDFISKELNNRHRVMEILCPPSEKFSTIELVKSQFEQCVEELNLMVSKLNVGDNNDEWACQIVAIHDTWTHARRKRRWAERHEDEVREDGKTPDVTASTVTTNGNEKAESSDPNDVLGETSQDEPILVCNVHIQTVKYEEEPDKNAIKISMVYIKGHGGRNSVETLRQCLINKLNLREYVQRNSSKESKKKRKKAKASSEMEKSASVGTSSR